jgi:hypothetical protein
MLAAGGPFPLRCSPRPRAGALTADRCRFEAIAGVLVAQTEMLPPDEQRRFVRGRRSPAVASRHDQEPARFVATLGRRARGVPRTANRRSRATSRGRSGIQRAMPPAGEDRFAEPPLDAVRRQFAYLAERSAFYRRRLGGLADRLRRLEDLRAVEYTTKDELRAGQERQPPFGEHLCASREALVRVHVTSGTTGTPVAIGLTRADHSGTARSGARRSGSPACAPTTSWRTALTTRSTPAGSPITWHSSPAEPRSFRSAWGSRNVCSRSCPGWVSRRSSGPSRIRRTWPAGRASSGSSRAHSAFAC